MDLAAARRDGDPACVLDALLGGRRSTDLAEQLRLELGEPGDPTAHRPAGVVLREPVRRDDVRIPRVLRRVVRIVRPIEGLGYGVVLNLVVKQVGDRRLDRLVVDWQGPVLEPDGREEPALPVAIHDERPVAGDGVHAARVLVRAVRWRLVSLEVGNVVADPLALCLVPPDILLALAPGLPFRVGGGAVVEDTPVHRPRPAPLQVRVVAGLAAAGLIDAFGVDSGVDPTPTRRRAVVLELGEPTHRLARLDLVAAYFLEDALYVGLFALAFCRIVPGHRFYEPVAVLPGSLVQLLHPAPEVEDEPGVRAGLARGIDGLVVPLQHTLGLG